MEKLNDKIVQSQIAREESKQCQIGTIIYNEGITEERARNIFAEMIPQALNNYTQDAYRTANVRIDKLEEIVIPRIVNIDGAIESFADPAFQLLLRKTQQTAAATEREDDYKLLSELLICHIQKGENRKNRTGITQAIEIVDDIDNDALCALTLVHAITNYRPVTGNIKEGIQILNNLFSKLMYMTLPKDIEWIDHLDVLRAVRINRFGTFKKTKAYFTEELSGYACIGLKIDSIEYRKSIELLNSVNFNESFLIPNELLDGYVRLPVCNKREIVNIPIITSGIERKIIKEEITILENIWEMYSKDDILQSKVDEEFMKLWDSFETLKQLRMWWDFIPVLFDITKVGTVLAYTNAKRCDPNIPDLL